MSFACGGHPHRYDWQETVRNDQPRPGRYCTTTFPGSRARDQLAAEETDGIGPPFFMSTAGPKGAPRTAGIGPLRDDGDLYFTSGPAARYFTGGPGGPRTRKSGHLSANPACTIAVRLGDLDLVLDGEAARVTDPPTLARLAARFGDQGRPAEVAGDAFTAPYSAPGAGPAPRHLYRFTFDTAVGAGAKEPAGATRWRLHRP